MRSHTDHVMTDTHLDSYPPDTDAANNDPAKTDADEEGKLNEPTDATATGGEQKDKETARRRVSISLRTLVLSPLVVLLVGALGALTWLYFGAEHKLDAQTRQSDNYAHAEKIALDYAVNAAAMDASNLGSWKTKLVAGTTPELNDKLTKAATSMEQILVPLKWNSSAAPLVAKVRSNNGTVYVVDAFVSVQTKTVQSPDSMQSTAAYSITIDSSKNWQINDVGGIGAMAGGK